MGKKLGLLFALFCVGTVLTQIFGFAYLSMTGKMNKERVGKMIAVAQGIEITPATIEKVSTSAKPKVEPPSLDDIDQFRSMKNRQMDLRAMNVANQLELIDTIKKYIDQEGKIQKQIRDAGVAERNQIATEEARKGRENIRELFEKLPPKQAKDEILHMYAAGEKEDIVDLLSAIPISQRVKIVREFKTEEESAKLSDLLRMIRENKTSANALDETKKPFDQVPGNGK